MTTKNISLLFITVLVVFISSCKGSKTMQIGICDNNSIWRDNNGIDSCSYYNDTELCDKIIGKINIKSRLHKNLIDKNNFGGGMSSRWFLINKNLITYYTPQGEIADKGVYKCYKNKLNVSWENNARTIEYLIHFNSKDFVELRYFDYPFSFDTFKYDSLKPPTNPTKIIGTLSTN